MSARGEGRTRVATIAALGAVVAVVAWFQAPFLLDREIVVERDALSSILPIRAFLAHALQQGSWPMWNPAPVLGKPFLPEWQTGLFYPPSLFLLVPPFSRGFNLFFSFHYVWTAVGAFLLLRALGTTRPAAWLGALVWTLGGPLVSLGHLLNHLMAVSWLPWVLWGWARSGDLRARIVTSSVLLAIALLTGSPEMALLIAGLLLVLARDVRALWVPPIAAMLAAMQLVPVWLYLETTHRGAHGLSTENVLAFSTPIWRLAELVYPGDPGPGAFLPSLYVGPIPVLLALVGLLFVPTLTRLLATLVALVLLGIAFGSNAAILPFLHEHVSGIDLLRYPEKLLVGVHALLALGAAWGLSGIASRWPGRIGVAAAAALALVAVADLARVNRNVLFTMTPQALFAPPDAARAMGAATAPTEMVRYYANSRGAPTPETLAEATEIDRELLYAATGELYGLANVNTPASLNLIEHERLNRTLESLPQEKALETLHALGTRWITSFTELRGDRVRPISIGVDRAKLYSLGSDAPRAFVAQQVGVALGPEAALDRFARSEVPLGMAVVEGIGVHDIAYRPPDRWEVQWVEAGNDRLTLDVAVDAPGLLVVNDSFLEGWRASVDGAPAALERVNGLVRGVWLAAGEHRVTMRYRPPGLAIGCALSLATLVGLLLVSYRGGK
ncbi:MAG: YfhO family protein [Candidatus Binatia bacterium]|nr:YfhO family protein [Candidatus Binatia bacterium]